MKRICSTPRCNHILRNDTHWTPQVSTEHTRSLSHEEFVVLGHEASVVRLSSEQKATLLKLFEEYDEDDSGTLDFFELPNIFMKELSIPSSVVDSIARDVDGDDGMVDKEGFLWIVARLVRVHENDFMMMQTLKDLTGSQESSACSEISVDMLKKNSAIYATDDEWEEMCWAMDLSAASGPNVWAEEAGLDFSELVTMVIAQNSSGKLLPALGTRPLARKDKSFAGKKVRESVAREVRDMVVDRRTVASSNLASDSACALLKEAFERDSVGTAVSSIKMISPAACKAGMDVLDERDWRHRLQQLLENPSSSRAAARVSLFVAFLIIVAILNNVAASLTDDGISVSWSSPFWVIDVVTTGLLTIEIIARAIAGRVVGPRTLVQFFVLPRNLVDLCAVLPTYIDAYASSANLKHLALLRFFRVLRLAQLARMGRLAKGWTLAAPITTVFVVIWGIYLKESAGSDSSSC